MSKGCKVLLGHCCLVADIIFYASKAVRSVHSSPSAVQQASLWICNIDNDIKGCCKVDGVKLSCPCTVCNQTLLNTTQGMSVIMVVHGCIRCFVRDIDTKPKINLLLQHAHMYDRCSTVVEQCVIRTLS